MVDVTKSEARMLDLPTLLEEIDAGLVALPEFQRDFDWDQKDVSALLVTVLKGWPAGSLLLMEGKAHFFRVRGFEAGPDILEDLLKYTVLDGQQRLTALYQAVYDKGPYVYAVMAQALEDGSVESLDEGVRAFKRDDWDARLRGQEWNDREQWVPMYVLPSASDYFAWRDRVVRATPQNEQDRVAARLAGLYRKSLEAVHKYKFPAVAVESALAPSAIARIFERVNKTGIRLSAFDLMVAKLYETDWNLRDIWELARRDRRLIDAFLADDGMPVLQVIALRYQRNIRETAVLNLAQPLVREEWQRAVVSLDDALTFLVRHCGVARPEWLPYRGMLIPLAAIAYEYRLDEHQDVLRKWFMSRAFGLAFDAAANTRLVSEYLALLEVLGGQRELHVPPASYSALYEASRRRQGPIWRAFLCLLVQRDAHDLDGTSLGLRISAESLEPIEGDILVSPLLPVGIDTGLQSEPAHRRVLNLVLTGRNVARALRDQSASQIGETAADEHGREAVEDALASQLLPDLGTLSEIEEDWQTLFDWRLRALTELLLADIGQSVERQQPIADAE